MVGKRPQQAISKLAYIVLSSARSCRSSICPGRLTTDWLVSQFLFDRLGGCIKLFVSTDGQYPHEFASRFGLAFFYSRKTPKNDRENRVQRKCMLNEPPSDPSKRGGEARHGQSISSDQPKRRHCGQIGDRYSQNGEKQQVKRATPRVYASTA